MSKNGQQFICYAEYSESTRYVCQCPNGHNAAYILQAFKFETLFDIGVDAFVDGYYREAVTTWSSSLERFYEFCVKILLRRAKVDKTEADKMWKNMSNQSERQLGAFLMGWTAAFGKAPALLPNPMVQKRNSAVHKGELPTREQALSYGAAVLANIREHTAVLRGNCLELILQLLMEQQVEARESRNDGVLSLNYHVTALNPPSSDFSTIEQIIEATVQRRKLLGG